MKKCPTCKIPFTRLDYEGFQIFQCSKCNGHLLRLNRLESIKRIQSKSTEELKNIAARDFHGDSSGIIKCPRCHLGMNKEKVHLPVLDLEIDTCKDCSLAWLDPGELALIQLAYETSERFIDAKEFQRRMAELMASPERKAEFEKRLAKARDSQDYLSEALGEAGLDVLYTILTTRISRRI